MTIEAKRIEELKARKAQLEELAQLETTVNTLELRLMVAPDQVALSRIVMSVCQCFGVSRLSLCGRDRHAKVAMARQACYWLCIQAGMSQSQVGRLFERDHGAVAHGCRAIEGGRDTNQKFRDRMDKLLAICRQDPGESAGRTSHPGTGVAAITP